MFSRGALEAEHRVPGPQAGGQESTAAASQERST